MTRIEYRDAMLEIWETAQNLSDNVESLSIPDYHELESKIDRLVVDLITEAQENGVLSFSEAKNEVEYCAQLYRAVHYACLSRVAWEYHYTQVFPAE